MKREKNIHLIFKTYALLVLPCLAMHDIEAPIIMCIRSNFIYKFFGIKTDVRTQDTSTHTCVLLLAAFEFRISYFVVLSQFYYSF